MVVGADDERRMLMFSIVGGEHQGARPVRDHGEHGGADCDRNDPPPYAKLASSKITT